MGAKKEKKEKELQQQAGDNNKMLESDQGNMNASTKPTEKNEGQQQVEEVQSGAENKLIEELSNKLKEKEEELKEFKNKYLMALAEIENMRKKMLRDKQNFYRSGIKDMALDVLQILDDIERAIEQIETAQDINAVREGIMLIHRKFKQMLESRKIKPIESKGQPFNPELHEALMKIETDRDEDHMKVVDELQKGYMIDDEVLRHSRVVVAVKNRNSGNGDNESNDNQSEETSNKKNDNQ